MRVLQIFNQYIYRGGEESSVERIFESLSQEYQMYRCWFSSEEWKGSDAPATWKQPFLMWSNPDSLNKLRQAHSACKPDCWLIHNVFPVGSAAIYREALRLKVPVIQYCHNFRPYSVNGYCWAGDRLAPQGLQKNYLPEIASGSWQNSRLKTAVFAGILSGLHYSGWLQSVKAWISISDFMRERYIDAGISPDKVFSLRHSWDLINPSSPAYQTDGSFLYLGRLTIEKGVRVLLKTWDSLYAEMGANCPKLCIGGQGPLEDEVRRAANKNPSILFEGFVQGDRKNELIADCRAMIAPSLWWEALGLVTYEAYDYCKPMLAAKSGGLTETVLHTKTGFLHEPGNAKQLAEQVIEISRNPEMAKTMGRAGREWLEQNTGGQAWLSRFNKIARTVTK